VCTRSHRGRVQTAQGMAGDGAGGGQVRDGCSDGYQMRRQRQRQRQRQRSDRGGWQRRTPTSQSPPRAPWSLLSPNPNLVAYLSMAIVGHVKHNNMESRRWGDFSVGVVPSPLSLPLFVRSHSAVVISGLGWFASNQGSRLTAHGSRLRAQGSRLNTSHRLMSNGRPRHPNP